MSFKDLPQYIKVPQRQEQHLISTVHIQEAKAKVLAFYLLCALYLDNG